MVQAYLPLDPSACYLCLLTYDGFPFPASSLLEYPDDRASLSIYVAIRL